MVAILFVVTSMYDRRKKKGKDQESIQSSTTPDPGYQWESDDFTIRHHKREPRGPGWVVTWFLFGYTARMFEYTVRLF